MNDKDNKEKDKKSEEPKKQTKVLIDKSCFTREELVKDKQQVIKDNPIIKK